MASRSAHDDLQLGSTRLMSDGQYFSGESLLLGATSGKSFRNAVALVARPDPGSLHGDVGTYVVYMICSRQPRPSRLFVEERWISTGFGHLGLKSSASAKRTVLSTIGSTK